MAASESGGEVDRLLGSRPQGQQMDAVKIPMTSALAVMSPPEGNAGQTGLVALQEAAGVPAQRGHIGISGAVLRKQVVHGIVCGAWRLDGPEEVGGGAWRLDGVEVS